MRQRASALLAGALLAGTLAACSNGVEAGTLDPPSATGARLDAGDLRIRNAVVVAGESGSLTVSMTIVNVGTAEDTLTDFTLISDDGAVAAELDPNSITLAPGSATVVPSEDGPTIDVDADVSPGGYVAVGLQFEQAGLIEFSLPVINEDSPYGSDVS
jgi:hypothetical protein